MHEIKVLRSAVLRFEFKADGFWDIKSMQQIMVKSINEWLLNILCKLLTEVIVATRKRKFVCTS